MTLTLVSFAGAAWAAGRSDDDRGGMAGAVLTLACYATVYLPHRWWWPMTADLSGPGATRRLVVTLLTATTIVAATSLDPARQPLLTRRH